MERSKYHWAPSAPFSADVAHVPVHGGLCRDKLEAMTYGRAVLLAELPDLAIARLDAEFPGVSATVMKCRRAALDAHGLSVSPHRFLSPKVITMAHSSSLKWVDFANLSRRGSWLEVLSIQGPISAAGAGVALESFFDEVRVTTQPSAPCLGMYSFEERCVASDCGYLLPRFSPMGPAASQPAWDEPPSKRLRTVSSTHTLPADRAKLQPIDVDKWRFPGALSLEASVRTMMLSIRGSWKSVRSGIWAWGILTTGLFPFLDPFDVNMEMLASFSHQFRNPDTLREYLGHLRFFLRVLHREFPVPLSTWQQFSRGSRKDRKRMELPRLRQKQVVQLVRVAMDRGWDDLARLFVVARGFLFRVANELLPLQSNGKLDPRNQEQWHSTVKVRERKVEVQLRTRKNFPQGATLVRACSCHKKLDLLCCACALARQLQLVDGNMKDSIWPFSPAEATKKFRQCCEAAGISWPGWHSFRRGMASDMLDNGAPLSLILRAGGWRSGAFLSYLTKSALDNREAIEFSMNDSDSEANA